MVSQEFCDTETVHASHYWNVNELQHWQDKETAWCPGVWK